MIRVCHIITQLELGGAQKMALYTAGLLDRSRFDVEMISGPGGMMDGDARGMGLPFHVVPGLGRRVSPVRDPLALMQLVRLLRRIRPDIVHTHSSKAGILGRWAATLAGVPHTVHTVHGFGFHPGQSRVARGVFVSLERLTGRMATSVVVLVSRANLMTGRDLELFDARRGTLIRYSMPLSEFHPAPAPRPAGTPLTVGMVACLKPQKAPLDFVAVAARVMKAGPALPPVRFVLVGDGVLRPEVEAAIANAGLGDVVTLAGWRRDVPEQLRGFDLLLHTSRWEGLPCVFMEAMATGLPIVATNVDGAPDIIEEDVTGHLLPPGDVEGLARRCVDVLRDGDRRRRMGEEALRRSSSWDPASMVRRLELLYEGLMREGPERAVVLSTQEAPG